jgi:molybdopterin-guanine dinucleotide biosynthesis protein A
MFDAVVLAGGAGRRFGGDKLTERVAGVPLIDRVLVAVTGAGHVVVVGPRRRYPTGVEVLREDPPGGGPVAALAAGLSRVRAAWVAVVAADLPFLTGADVARLWQAAVQVEGGAVLVDPDGREQWLAGVYPTEPVRAAVGAGVPVGAAARDTLGPLVAVRVPPAADPRRPPAWFDCDTPAQLALARRWHERVG